MSLERLEERVVLTTKIVTIGDSWASFLADGAPGSITDLAGYNNAFQQVLNTRAPGVEVYNGGFYGGTAAGHVTQLPQIGSIINAAGPDVDLVYLSSGGNDFLAGLAAGGWYRGKPANEVQSLFDTVGNNVRTVAEYILSLRPDIQVVIPSYDYINLWDFNLTSGGDNVRLNLGLVRSNNWAVDAIQNADLNSALRDLESRKAAIGAGNSRIHYVNMLGLNQSLVGYQGYLSNNVNLPPGSWPDLPVRKSSLGSNGNDPIHLTDAAYAAMVDTVYSQWMGQALQTGLLSANTNSLSFGQVRAGTSSALQTVSISNAGVSFSKIKNISFGGASGGFTGGGTTANPLFRDPTLGSDTASASYGFAPTSRGNFSQVVNISSNGGTQGVTLSGQAVGPVGSVLSTPSFNVARPGQSQLGQFGLGNFTPDGDLGSLTNLTIHSASFTGPDASLFELVGFTPGSVVTAGQFQNFTIRFIGGVAPRSYNATLVLQTDQGAASGGSGASFQVPIQAQVNDGFILFASPDPSNGTLNSLFGFGWNGDDSIQFQQVDSTTIRAIVTKENGQAVNRTTDFVGITGRVIVDGSSGNDSLDAGALVSTAVSLTGSAGNDTLRGGQAADVLDGGQDDDWLAGGSGGDTIWGGAGADTIYGEYPASSGLALNAVNLGGDLIDGGIGNDTIFGDGDGGEGASDSILGGDGNDVIVGDGTVGKRLTSDTIRGGQGNDLIKGDADGAEGSPDSLFGDTGNDTIDSGGGDDWVDGGADDDLLLGGDGAEGSGDTLIGNAGRDVLVGDLGVVGAKNMQGGKDSLDGGAGEDVLIAGAWKVSDLNAWSAVGLEWSSSRSYAERVSNLSGTGSGPRDNGDFFLRPGVEVVLDRAPTAPPTVNTLGGGADQDWFLYELSDVLVDLSLVEMLTLIS
jgi:lysophospholipase L1-like esterase